jgi:hypothetical protein
MMDILKLLVILGGYLVLAPALGWIMANRPAGRRWGFALLVFMTSWHINKLTLMFQSVEFYRGHTKGYEGSVMTLLALALLWSFRLPQGRGFRWLPPGAGLWLLQCALCTLSVFAAPNASYVWMAAWKFTSAAVIFAAAYHCIEDETDLRWLLRAMTVTLCVQAVVVLKLKYVDGFYQVRGWFEHQNPLAMWAYLLGLPLLAAALGPGDKRETKWHLAGFIAAAVIIQSSLSRASLAAFAVGVAAVCGLSLWDGINLKRLRMIFGLGAMGALGLLASLNTLISRFKDEGNQASGETRIVMNLASAAMLRESWVGIGWNNFALTINPPYPYGEVIDQWERDRGHRVDADYAKGVVESHYWLLLAENGYPGLMGYLLFIGVTGWWVVRGIRAGRGTLTAAFLAGLAVALVLIYLHSSLERVLTQTKNLSLWLLLLGVATRLDNNRRCLPMPK